MSKRFITHKKRIWIPLKGNQQKLSKEEIQIKKNDSKVFSELAFYICLAIVCIIGLLLF